MPLCYHFKKEMVFGCGNMMRNTFWIHDCGVHCLPYTCFTAGMYLPWLFPVVQSQPQTMRYWTLSRSRGKSWSDIPALNTTTYIYLRASTHTKKTLVPSQCGCKCMMGSGVSYLVAGSPGCETGRQSCGLCSCWTSHWSPNPETNQTHS